MSRAGCLPENRFSVPYLGRTFRFCRRSAWQELQFSGAVERLLEHLPGADLPGRQKQAVAGNAVLLWQALDGPDAAGSPEEILRRFSAGQIADLVRLYFEPDGGGEVWYDECGVNAGFSGEEGAV